MTTKAIITSPDILTLSVFGKRYLIHSHPHHTPATIPEISVEKGSPADLDYDKRSAWNYLVLGQHDGKAYRIEIITVAPCSKADFPVAVYHAQRGSSVTASTRGLLIEFASGASHSDNDVQSIFAAGRRRDSEVLITPAALADARRIQDESHQGSNPTLLRKLIPVAKPPKQRVEVSNDGDVVSINGSPRKLTKQQAKILGYFKEHRTKPLYIREACEKLKYKGGNNCKLSVLFREPTLRDALFLPAGGKEQYRLRISIRFDER